MEVGLQVDYLLYLSDVDGTWILSTHFQEMHKY